MNELLIELLKSNKNVENSQRVISCYIKINNNIIIQF